jgi:hypothetical protein
VIVLDENFPENQRQLLKIHISKNPNRNRMSRQIFDEIKNLIAESRNPATRDIFQSLGG